MYYEISGTATIIDDHYVIIHDDHFPFVEQRLFVDYICKSITKVHNTLFGPFNIICNEFDTTPRMVQITPPTTKSVPLPHNRVGFVLVEVSNGWKLCFSILRHDTIEYNTNGKIMKKKSPKDHDYEVDYYNTGIIVKTKDEAIEICENLSYLQYFNSLLMNISHEENFGFINHCVDFNFLNEQYPRKILISVRNMHLGVGQAIWLEDENPYVIQLNNHAMDCRENISSTLGERKTHHIIASELMKERPPEGYFFRQLIYKNIGLNNILATVDILNIGGTIKVLVYNTTYFEIYFDEWLCLDIPISVDDLNLFMQSIREEIAPV